MTHALPISTFRPIEVMAVDQNKVAGTKSHADGTSLDALYLVAKNGK